MKDQEKWVENLEQDIYQEIIGVTQRFPIEEQQEIQKVLAEIVDKAQDNAFMRGYEYAMKVLENGLIKK